MIDAVYLDTSIWLDIYLERPGRNIITHRLFQKIIQEEIKIYISDVLIIELRKLGFSSTEIREMFAPYEQTIVYITASKMHHLEGRPLAYTRKIPRADVLHALLAREYHLQLIATDRDFLSLKDITTVITPEQFLQF